MDPATKGLQPKLEAFGLCAEGAVGRTAGA
jgi:hypothetical protein